MVAGSKRKIALAITIMLTAAYSLVAVPQASAAEEEREVRNQSIFITKDTQFTDVNGVRSGSGTASDPFIISNWDVSEIYIADTGRQFVIKNNTVDFLTLNWNGNNVDVRNNEVGDLRVNENVKRTGEPTTGNISNNTFGVVSQIRHFDGVFAHNVVGVADDVVAIPLLSNERAINSDGFNGARFYDNTVYGYWEVRLHGHHHSSSFGDSSHNHGPEKDEAAHEGHDPASMANMDHTNRFHEVWIRDNTIHASGPYAIIYTDSNHAGNDRTANSEENKDLEKNHQHHTRIQITDNKLVGSGINVNIFNADDERHIRTNRGLMEIARNDITLQYAGDEFPFQRLDGLTVWNAKDIALQIIGNKIRYDGSEDLFEADNPRSTSGIFLQQLRNGNVTIADNYVENFFYGVRATDMSEDLFWKVLDLETVGVSDQIAWDASVKNEPKKDR